MVVLLPKSQLLLHSFPQILFLDRKHVKQHLISHFSPLHNDVSHKRHFLFTVQNKCHVLISLHEFVGHYYCVSQLDECHKQLKLPIILIDDDEEGNIQNI